MRPLTRCRGDPPRFHMRSRSDSAPGTQRAAGWTAGIRMRSFPIEYYILRNAGPNEGPIVGYLAGQPILGSVVDPLGRRYRFAGLAPRLRDGQFDVASLRPGEWIVEPGLVYMSDDDVGPQRPSSTGSH
jgi:hypothetical protein